MKQLYTTLAVASLAFLPLRAQEETILDEPMTTQASFNNLTVLDVNGDGRTWDYNSFYQAARWSMNSALPGDDWLVSPPLELQEGKSYRFTIDMRPLSMKADGLEHVEVFMGTDATPEALTTEVLPEFIIYVEGEDPDPGAYGAPMFNTYTGYLVPSATGTYRVGVHAMSPEDTWGIYARNFRVYEGVQAAGPDEVTNPAVTPDPAGEYTARIDLTAPIKNTLGEPILSLSKIEILRGDDLVHTFTAPEPGAPLSFTDNLPESGTYTWTITPYNEHGQGKSIQLTAYVGVKQPMAPAFASFTETDTEGEVTVTWSPVDTDITGNPIDPSKITYKLLKVQGATQAFVVAEGLTSTSYTFQAAEPGDQELLDLAIRAVTEGGESDPVQTQSAPVGTPYSLPWAESFPNGSISSGIVLGTQTLVGNSSWSISKDTSFQNMHSADDDNGYLSCWSTNSGEAARFYTGKFHLTGLQNPIFSFYIYKRSKEGIQDLGTIEVQLNDGAGWQTIQTVTAEPYPQIGWNRVTVPIPAEWEGKIVQLGLLGTSVNYLYQFADDLRITDGVQNNLTVTDISAPTLVDRCEDFDLAFTYANTGLSDATAYTLTLLANGEPLQIRQGDRLNQGASRTSYFHLNHGYDAEEHMVYSVRIDWSEDLKPEDNISKDVEVRTFGPTLPVVTKLEANQTPGGNTITWENPEYDPSVPGTLTDDFEDYTPFEHTQIGDWRLHDLDHGQIGGFHTPDGVPLVIPENPMNSQRAWWVMDSRHSNFDGYTDMNPHSGRQYLAQQYIVGGGSVDDWIVSPEIAESEPQVSFYARSYMASEPETLEILASSTTRLPEAFQSVQTFQDLPESWTECRATLPEGTRYFAIRCISQYKAMCFVDDVTYTPAGLSNLRLQGYHVWRNGEQITDQPVNDIAYTDPNGTLAHTYAVQAIWSHGPAALSESVSVSASSLSGPQATPQPVQYFNLQGLPLPCPPASGLYIERTPSGSRLRH